MSVQTYIHPRTNIVSSKWIWFTGPYDNWWNLTRDGWYNGTECNKKIYSRKFAGVYLKGVEISRKWFWSISLSRQTHSRFASYMIELDAGTKRWWSDGRGQFSLIFCRQKILKDVVHSLDECQREKFQWLSDVLHSQYFIFFDEDVCRVMRPLQQRDLNERLGNEYDIQKNRMNGQILSYARLSLEQKA